MNAGELRLLVAAHRKWLDGFGGTRACLGGADLRNADLRGADLRRAQLCETNLRGADLRGAKLRGADLRWADVRGANLPDGVRWCHVGRWAALLVGDTLTVGCTKMPAAEWMRRAGDLCELHRIKPWERAVLEAFLTGEIVE